jgi:hypothetical protein
VGYRELSLPSPHPKIVISGESYDVDYFGMDDGRSPDPGDALRFMFQLGSGLMIYLYVIQAGGARDLDHFSHRFWLKDCAVADVDAEERGPPSAVEAPSIVLPRVYASITLARTDEPGERTHAIASQTFRARKGSSGEQELEMLFVLGAEGAPAGRLLWSRAGAWAIELAGAPRRRLGRRDRLRFTASS